MAERPRQGRDAPELRAPQAAMTSLNAFFPMCYGSEFIATVVRGWLGRLSVKTLYIEPGSPWENGYCESFNSKLRDEFLDRQIVYTLKEAQTLIEWWRRHYNQLRPHSSLGYKPPAIKTILPAGRPPPYYELWRHEPG